ncbi:helix-turn-helix domain-containing protein [Streptomyces sp. NPDC002643]
MYQIDGLVTGDRATAGVSAQDAWRDWCSDVHGEFGIDFPAESYRGRVMRQRTSTYQLVSWTGESEHVRREARGIRRDPRGHYELFVPLRDRLHVGSDSVDRALQTGEMALVPIDAPFHVAHADGAAALTLLIPFERIDQRLGLVAPRGQRIVGRKGLPGVTRDLLVSLIRERDHLSGAEFDSVCDRIVDLFCLAAAGDEKMPSTSGTTAVLDAVRRYVREHVTDPDLSVAAMSSAIGWSSRYIQAVLAREGTTATELIRHERLDLARTRLSCPTFASQSIADVAASVGFSSPSAFSSAFRQHFGTSPREVRRQI